MKTTETTITFGPETYMYHLRTMIALKLSVTCVVSNCFRSSIVTLLASKAMYKIAFL